MRRPRPLDPIRSLKAKWSIVILASVAVTAGTSQIGLYLGWPVWVRPVVAGVLALGAVQVLAHGMILPLREMAVGASEMRKGLYQRRVQVTARDEIGQLAAAFNQMAADLAEVDRLQKEFVANASHELRTPVAALRGQIENLADGVVQASPALLGTMLAQAEHLSTMVTRLLDLSRLEVGAPTGPVEPCDLEMLINQVVDEAGLLDPDARIRLDLHGPLTVPGDDARLHQLFTNLLGNGLRFTPDGEHVLIRAWREGGVALVEIRDRGPGIEPGHRARVFERFWQADGTTPTGGGGAGLGLALCKRIVDRHEGTIELGDNEPSGTCVTVTLPVRAEHGGDMAERTTDPGSGPGRDSGTGRAEQLDDVAGASGSGMGGNGDEQLASGDGEVTGRVIPDGADRSAAPVPVGPLLAGQGSDQEPPTGTAVGPGDRSSAGTPGSPPPPFPQGSPPPPWTPGPVQVRMPTPLPGMSPALALAIAAAAVSAGLAVQLPGPGLALSLSAVAVAGIAMAARAVDRRSHRLAVGLLVACGTQLTFRSSPWVSAVGCLAVAGLAWLLAIDGLTADRPRSWLAASGEAFVNLFDWVPWLARSAGAASRAVAPDRDVAVVARAAAVAGTIVLVIGGLLASGDAVFGHVVTGVFGGAWVVDVVIILFMVIPASILALTASRRVEPGTRSSRTFRTEALTGLWATTAMLAVWCGIQVVVAAGGARSVLAAEGVTAADYAREGFFQLVAVAAISLTVVHLAHRVGGGDRLPVSVIGVGLTVLITISYTRLAYYMDAFGLTMLRLSVATFLGWLAVMTAASVARSWGLGAGREWVPTVAVLAAGTAAALYGVADPEGLVTRANLDRADTIDQVDLDYLTELSDDARVVVADYDWSRLGGRPPELDVWLCEGTADQVDGVLGWNRSDRRAGAFSCP